MTEHTPGPWKTALREGLTSVSIRANGYSLAAVWGKKGAHRPTVESIAEGRANARLMTAAPDMLAALRNIVAWEDSDTASGENIDYEGWTKVTAIARTVIAKATGE
jgi:hypothetical protein